MLYCFKIGELKVDQFSWSLNETDRLPFLPNSDSLKEPHNYFIVVTRGKEKCKRTGVLKKKVVGLLHLSQCQRNKHIMDLETIGVRPKEKNKGVSKLLLKGLHDNLPRWMKEGGMKRVRRSPPTDEGKRYSFNQISRILRILKIPYKTNATTRPSTSSL